MMPEEVCDYTVSRIGDEEKVLREFLEMPLESTDVVFKKFLDLKMPGCQRNSRCEAAFTRLDREIGNSVVRDQ